MQRRKSLIIATVLVMGLGLGLIFGAGILVLHNGQESEDAGVYARDMNKVLVRRIEDSPVQEYLSNPEFIPDYKLNPDMDMPTSEVSGDLYIGQLSIPCIGLDLAVQSDWSYPQLKKTPCRYAGTPYKDDFVICAHNYKTHFGPIKELVSGDLVCFTDMDGNVFEYTVQEVREIAPKPYTQVTESGYDLVLFTCTLGGKTRVAVYCDLI